MFRLTQLINIQHFAILFQLFLNQIPSIVNILYKMLKKIV